MSFDGQTIRNPAGHPTLQTAAQQEAIPSLSSRPNQRYHDIFQKNQKAESDILCMPMELAMVKKDDHEQKAKQAAEALERQYPDIKDKHRLTANEDKIRQQMLSAFLLGDRKALERAAEGLKNNPEGQKRIAAALGEQLSGHSKKGSGFGVTYGGGDGGEIQIVGAGVKTSIRPGEGVISSYENKLELESVVRERADLHAGTAAITAILQTEGILKKVEEPGEKGNLKRKYHLTDEQDKDRAAIANALARQSPEEVEQLIKKYKDHPDQLLGIQRALNEQFKDSGVKVSFTMMTDLKGQEIARLTFTGSDGMSVFVSTNGGLEWRDKLHSPKNDELRKIGADVFKWAKSVATDAAGLMIG